MAKKFDDFGKLYAYVMKNAKRSAITATKNVTRRIKDDMYKKALENLNNAIFMEDWNKYAIGTISAWEMKSLCFYYHEHELENANYGKYGIADFFSLPEEPVVDRSFVKGGKTINLFKLTKICGTCIAKDKNK